MKQHHVVIFSILLAVVISILVWDKQPTIYPYALLALMAGTVLAVAILDGNGKVIKPSTVFAIFLIAFLLVPNIWFVSTHYAALQASDVTSEYAIANTFSDYGKAFVVPPTLDSMRLTNYSTYPLLHILAVTIGHLAEIDTYVLAMILPSIFGVVGFLFLYLLVTKLTYALGLSKILIPISLLIYALAPEAIFAHLRFVRQGLALVLVLILFYLIYKFILTRDWRIGALIICDVAVLAPVHHFSSFLMAIYLSAFLVLALVLALLSRRLTESEWRSHLRKLFVPCLLIGIIGILSAATFLWWNRLAVTALQPSQEILASFEATTTAVEPAIPVEPATETMAPGAIRQAGSRSLIAVTEIEELEPYVPESHYPDKLTPPWVHLLKIRDFLIYVPVFFGFGWLIRRRLKSKFNNYEELVAFSLLIFSLALLGALFFFDLFVAKIVPYRIALLSLPFIALGSSILYGHILWRRKLAVAVVLVFVITCSFLGLWAHRIVPVHIYSSSVSVVEVGEAIPLEDRHYALGEFLGEQNRGTNISRIISEDSHLLYPILPPQAYPKIGPFRRIYAAVQLSEAITHGESVAVADFGQSIYTYATGRTREPEEAEQVETEYHIILETHMNRVYDNGFSIWAR